MHFLIAKCIFSGWLEPSKFLSNCHIHRHSNVHRLTKRGVWMFLQCLDIQGLDVSFNPLILSILLKEHSLAQVSGFVGGDQTNPCESCPHRNFQSSWTRTLQLRYQAFRYQALLLESKQTPASGERRTTRDIIARQVNYCSANVSYFVDNRNEYQNMFFFFYFPEEKIRKYFRNIANCTRSSGNLNTSAKTLAFFLQVSVSMRVHSLWTRGYKKLPIKLCGDKSEYAGNLFAHAHIQIGIVTYRSTWNLEMVQVQYQSRFVKQPQFLPLQDLLVHLFLPLLNLIIVDMLVL